MLSRSFWIVPWAHFIFLWFYFTTNEGRLKSSGSHWEIVPLCLINRTCFVISSLGRLLSKSERVWNAQQILLQFFLSRTANMYGIIFIDYLENGKTINGKYYTEYYTALLQHLIEEIIEKRPHFAKKKVLFHRDSAPTHTSVIVMSKIHDLGFELLPHPLSSPDLALSNYHLFPNLEKWLGGQRFSSNDKEIAAVDGYFDDLDISSYAASIKKLLEHWTKCISLNGDYIEK